MVYGTILFYIIGMDARTLQQALAALGISQADFSRLIQVTPRAISLWLSGERELSGPAAAYLRLLVSLPRVLQSKELARIRQEDDPAMAEGMYKFDYQGTTGSGLGVMVLSRGRVFGSDGGVQYDGTCEPSRTQPGYVDVHLHLSVPPGVALVQGVPPQTMSYGFDLACSFAARGSTSVNVATPFGPVLAQITFLRPIPA